MNDPHLLPEERLKKLYAQTEANALFTLDSKLRAGISIKKFVKSGQAMIFKINNDYSEKNYSGTYLSSLKAIILYNQIRTKFKANDPLYAQGLSRDDFNECIKVLTYALDMAEKVKGNLIQEFQVEHQRYLDYCKEQERLDEVRRIKEEQQRHKLEMEAKERAKSHQVLPPSYDQNSIKDHFPQFANTFNQPSSKPIDSHNKIPPARPPQPQTLMSNKDLIIPSNLCHRFRQLAAPNNSKNIETCGFLFGEEISSNQYPKKYKITHLLIPKQSGTADTCSPSDEAEIIMFTSQFNNLVQLGWIHTHPSQTAFLSSVDMHTQFGIQMLMPQAIAIVCSIKYNEDKFLKLTKLGLDQVQKSLSQGVTQSMNFHSYDEKSQMQEDCSGLVEIDNSLKLEVVDQR